LSRAILAIPGGIGSLGHAGTVAEKELRKSLCFFALLRACVDARRRKTLPASWLCCMRRVADDGLLVLLFPPVSSRRLPLPEPVANLGQIIAGVNTYS